jgi:hypothetical protein
MSYIVHVLNLVIQDILKNIIKDNYNTSYTIDICNKEEDIEELEV